MGATLKVVKDMKFSDRITALLKNESGISPLQRKTTMAELAAYLNVKPQTISLWSLGKTEPTVTHIVETAEFFKISTDFLLGVSSNTGNAEAENRCLERISRALSITKQLVKELEGES